MGGRRSSSKRCCESDGCIRRLDPASSTRVPNYPTLGVSRENQKLTSQLPTTHSLAARRPYRFSFLIHAPGGSRVRPNGRASSTSCAGDGDREHFATA